MCWCVREDAFHSHGKLFYYATNVIVHNARCLVSIMEFRELRQHLVGIAGWLVCISRLMD